MSTIAPNKMPKFDAYESMARLADIGYKCVEISQVPMNKENIAGFRRAIDELGFNVAAISANVAPNPMMPGFEALSNPDDFKKMVRGNCTTTATYNSNSALSFALNYDEQSGRVTREERAGYFNVVEGGTTLEVTFSGKMDLEGDGNAKTYRMTKAFTDVKAKSWRHITFIKKIDEEGNATFDIMINDYAEDAPIEEGVDGVESVLGSDPNQPQGDGGIELVSTCDFDITKDVIIPNVVEEGVVNMLLTMQANVPNGVKKFSVAISSTSPGFTAALDVVAEYDEAAGGHVVDLVSPTEKNMGIFDIVPFPHGAELNGATEILFNLSAAQIPILAFPGTHSFVMTVIDAKGCKKDTTIKMVVPDYKNM